VGQDLAFAEDGRTHAAGTMHEGTLYTADENLERFYVQGNDGGKVLTNRLFNEFRLFIETWIQVYADRRYINATEGGALIAGTQITALREVIDTYCRQPVEVKKAILEAQQEQQARLSQEQAQAILYRRLTDARQVMEWLESIRKQLKQLKQAVNNKDIVKIEQCRSRVNKTISNYAADKHIRPAVEILTYNEIRHLRYKQNEALYAGEKNADTALSEYQLYYEKVFDGTKKVKSWIEQAIEGAKN
jgi:hypothetical protein